VHQIACSQARNAEAKRRFEVGWTRSQGPPQQFRSYSTLIILIFCLSLLPPAPQASAVRLQLSRSRLRRQEEEAVERHQRLMHQQRKFMQAEDMRRQKEQEFGQSAREQQK